MTMTKLVSPPIRPPTQTEIDRSIPNVSPPSSSTLAPTSQATDTFTYYTKSSTEPQQLYTGDRPWAQVTVLLETAGPVAVATKQNFLPVLSGKGRLLTTGQSAVYILPKGSRLYVAATAVNRVSVVVEPIPWLEQLYAASLNQTAAQRAALDQLVRLPQMIVTGLAKLFGGKK